jgi:hypothetical protein
MGGPQILHFNGFFCHKQLVLGHSRFVKTPIYHSAPIDGGIILTSGLPPAQDVAVDSWYEEFMEWATEPTQAELSSQLVGVLACLYKEMATFLLYPTEKMFLKYYIIT